MAKSPRAKKPANAGGTGRKPVADETKRQKHAINVACDLSFKRWVEEEAAAVGMTGSQYVKFVLRKWQEVVEAEGNPLEINPFRQKPRRLL